MTPSKPIHTLFILMLALSILVAGCAQTPAQAQEVRADVARQTSPEVPPADLQELVQSNTTFALDIYRNLREQEGNLFYSPYSISTALAMTYAGAKSETEQQMADTLHFTLPQDRLHPAFNALDLALTESEQADEEGRFELHVANSLWGQQGFTFRDEFLEILARHYGAGLRLLDFETNPDEAAEAINAWVSQQTNDKIQDLIPPGQLNQYTRLVLANAIYFNARWLHTFEESDTQSGDFTLLDGRQVDAQMMHQTEQFRYTEADSMQIVELPYRGADMSMFILLPERESFEELESSLDADRLDELIRNLEPKGVTLTLPKFEFEARLNLNETLQSLGMPKAFTPPSQDGADFSGMTGERNLYISNVFHKAYVAVDEAGTEAAAATAVEMRTESALMPDVTFTADHPFIFLIRGNSSGAILFIGRMLDPR